MEFPLYQWCVVLLSNATGQSLTTAARTVSLACFYLTLPGWYLLLGLVGVLAARRVRAAVLLLLAAFLTVQLIFPALYAYHDYYYVANGWALLFAAGLVLHALLEGRIPAWAAVLAILAVHGVQVRTYLHGHYQQMRFWQPGGNALTFAVQRMTDPDEVILISGDDWSSLTPYYTRRRALMLPNGTGLDAALRARTFGALQGEKVTALVLRGAERDNAGLLAEACTTFGLDPRPVFTFQDSTVYLHRRHRLAAIPEAGKLPHLMTVQLTPESLAEHDTRLRREVELAEYLQHQLAPVRARFAALSPQPWKFYSTYGMELFTDSGGEFLGAHPDTRLWFHVPAGAHRVLVECFIAPAAYAESLQPGEASDGVEFVIARPEPGGGFVTLASRLLDPRRHPGDRGLQELRYEGPLPVGGEVVVLTRPGPAQNYTRDWAGLGRIIIR